MAFSSSLLSRSKHDGFLLLLTTSSFPHGQLQAIAAAAAIRDLSGHRPPLPLPDPPPPPPHRLLHRRHRQAPPLLPHASGAPHLLPPPLSLAPSPARLLSASAYGEPDEEVEESPEADPARSADREVVGRVCAAIAELLAGGGDHNLEAILSSLAPPLSEGLVVSVLDRFKHAHRPAHRFFRWAAASGGFAHTPATYCKMLRILGKTRQFESMVSLLQEMGKARALCMEAFKIALKSFAAAREIKKSLGIFELMKMHGFDAGVDSFNCLLEALAREKLGREAWQLFDRMRDRYEPDLRTYTALLLGWCNAKNLVEAGKIWNEMLDKGIQPDIVTHNTMIEGLLRGQRRPEAVKMYELMKAKGPSPNVWTYTILIQEHCKRGKMDLAVQCLEEMQEAGCKPDVATYTCLLVGFGNARRMDKVSELLKEMKEKGCPPDGRTYNALIKLMTNRNMPDDAARIYKTMLKKGLEPTIHTYNMMMKSYFNSGNNYLMGCEVWEEMARKGVCPDVNSYTVLISGHIRHGRPEEAYKYIEEMINKGMRAPEIDYNKFAADFSRAGKPDVLYELAEKMNFSGKSDASNVFHHWAERMKNRVSSFPNPAGSGAF